MQHDKLELADTRARLPSTGTRAKQGAAGWDDVSQLWAALSQTGTPHGSAAMQQCHLCSPKMTCHAQH